MAVLVAAGGARTAAQAPSDSGFLAVRVGAQPQRPTIRATHGFDLFDEAATVESIYHIDNGPVFDVSGGYRAGPELLVGAGVSVFRSRGPSTATASIPDPIFFDRFRTVMVESSDHQRTEIGIHGQVGWLTRVGDRLEILLSAGPSLVRLSQELTPSFTVAAGTGSVTLVRERQSGTGVGVNAGFDGTFMFDARYGAGLFLRYAGGSVDLPDASDVRVGGFQTGLGLHVRF
jgi:hypothetical protein